MLIVDSFLGPSGISIEVSFEEKEIFFTEDSGKIYHGSYPKLSGDSITRDEALLLAWAAKNSGMKVITCFGEIEGLIKMTEGENISEIIAIIVAETTEEVKIRITSKEVKIKVQNWDIAIPFGAKKVIELKETLGRYYYDKEFVSNDKYAEAMIKLLEAFGVNVEVTNLKCNKSD